MTAIVAVAQFFPKPDQKDAFRTAIGIHAAAFRAEDGCELYAVHEAADRFFAISRWRNADALAAHAKGAAAQEMRGAVTGLVDRPTEVVRGTPADSSDLTGALG